MSADDESEGEEPPLIIACVGPPICMLIDEAAIAAMNKGCVFCKRMEVLEDGSTRLVDGSRGRA